MNECEEILNHKLSEAEKVREANNNIKLYFSGKASPEWMTFYFSYDCPEKFRKQLIPGIVERIAVSGLVNVFKKINGRSFKTIIFGVTVANIHYKLCL
jgi:hypothetical protein